MSDIENTGDNTPTDGTDLPSITIEEEMKQSYLDYAMSVICLLYTSDAADE